jgi:chemotaxis protein MotB
MSGGRKKKPEAHVNHERWLVSYADFITLLFAFFVVMFAVSQVDSKRLGRFTEAFSKAVGEDMMPERGTGLLPDDTVKPPENGIGDEALPPELEVVRTKLLALADTLKGLQVIQRRNELVLRLSDNIFFESGDDKLKPPAIAMIHTLGPELSSRSLDIRVEGHTDDRPIINTARFRSNWELSTARATVVLERLAQEGIAPPSLSAAGYGEFRPIAPNTTEDGRKQNRRVDLILAIAVPPEHP